MKRLHSAIVCILLIISIAISVCATASVPEAVMNATKSVVRVLAEYSDGYATGSGFVVTSNKDETLIATNYHVVEENPYSISVWLSDNETVSASILAYTDQKDMCILRLAYPINDMQALPFAENGAKQGDAVFAVGFPGAADVLSDKDAHTSAEATITDGIVSAVREATVSSHGTPTKILQINAAINSGNSGGPLFNADGEVVGINTYGINDSQGIFGSIEVSELKAFMEDNGIPIPTLTAKAKFPWVGILITTGIIICIVVILFVMKMKKTQKAKAQTAKKVMPLSEFMSQYPDGVGINEAVAMLLPVALQLRDLHNNGSVHLQVSPEAISVGSNGAILADATPVESNRYTSGYAAPEIYKGMSAGNLSDIYSFCALLSYVASGKHPLNSLSRADSEGEDIEPQLFDPGFTEVVQAGMALDSQNRFASMQDVIIKLSPYNVQRFTTTAPDVAESSAAPRENKNFLKIAAILVVIALIAGFFGVYARSYNKAKSLAQNAEFTAAEDQLIIPQITQLHDDKLLSYIEAGKLLSTRQYDEAKTRFAELAGYLNADELALESDYRHAAQYADSNNFQEAQKLYKALKDYKDSETKVLDVMYREGTYLLLEENRYSDAYNIFVSLSLKGYPKADEMKMETEYRWAFDLIDQEKYLEAFRRLKTIKDYSNVDEVLEQLAEIMYLEGQLKYADQRYRDAYDFFECIPDYLDSSKYMTLINARYYPELSAIQTVKDLKDIFYFEDAAELLLYYQEYAEIYLVGVWSTIDGYYEIEWEANGDAVHSLPSLTDADYKYYYIKDGKYMVYTNNENNAKLQYRLKLIAPDTLEVYCAKNGKTYTLYR